jgi:hypothetical protein
MKMVGVSCDQRQTSLASVDRGRGGDDFYVWPMAFWWEDKKVIEDMEIELAGQELGRGRRGL